MLDYFPYTETRHVNKMPVNLLGRLIAAGMWEEVNEKLNRVKNPEKHWNRCNSCGRYIPYQDFANGDATRTRLSSEEYETRCRDHINGRRFTADWDLDK